MKLTEIKPCSEDKNMLMIEFCIDLKTKLQDIYTIIKKNPVFEKATYAESLNMIWATSLKGKIMIFGSGRIVINRLKNKENAESMLETIENMLNNA